MCLQKILKNIVKVSEDDVGPHREARHLQSCPDYIGDIKIIDLQSIKVYIFSTAQMSGALVGLWFSDPIHPSIPSNPIHL